MTSESYGSVVLDVLKQNRKVGKSLVDAYRVGGISLVQKNLSGKLGRRGDKVTNLLIKGIAKTSDGTEVALNIVGDQASKAIEAVIAKVDGVENKYATKVIDVFSRISLPGAKIARRLSSKLAEGTAKIQKHAAVQVADKGPRKASRKAPRKAVKQARSARKA